MGARSKAGKRWERRVSQSQIAQPSGDWKPIVAGPYRALLIATHGKREEKQMGQQGKALPRMSMLNPKIGMDGQYLANGWANLQVCLGWFGGWPHFQWDRVAEVNHLGGGLWAGLLEPLLPALQPVASASRASAGRVKIRHGFVLQLPFGLRSSPLPSRGTGINQSRVLRHLRLLLRNNGGGMDLEQIPTDTSGPATQCS